MAIKQPPARKKPTLACHGVVDTVSDEQNTSSGTYVMIKMKLLGTDGGDNAYFNYLFREEWFDPTFSPASYDIADDPRYTPEQKQAAKSLLAVYRMHMMSSKQTELSSLQALCGSAANFTAFDTELNTLPAYDATSIASLIRKYISGQSIGYILGQEMSKEEITDPISGEVTIKKVPGERYEIKGWFYPGDAKGLKRLEERAKKNPADFVVTFQQQYRGAA